MLVDACSGKRVLTKSRSLSFTKSRSLSMSVRMYLSTAWQRLRLVFEVVLVSNTTTTVIKSIDQSISRPTQSDASSSSSLNQQSDTPHDDAQNDVRAAETGKNDDSSPALLTGSCEFVT